MTDPGSAIAAAALKYKGKGYVSGGKADKPGDWDCSSFVSYVLGHDLGLGLPGGVWNGAGMPPHAHGPVVGDYRTWAGSAEVASPQPGDLCIYGPDVHIGIAISSRQMISALNPENGTTVTAIDPGIAPGDLTFRRLTGVPAVQTSLASAQNMNAASILALIMVGGTLAAAGLIVLEGLVGAVWLAGRLIQRG